MIERREHVRLEMSNEIYGMGGQGGNTQGRDVQGGDKPRPYNIRYTGTSPSIVGAGAFPPPPNPSLRNPNFRSQPFLHHYPLSPTPHHLPPVWPPRCLRRRV